MKTVFIQYKDLGRQLKNNNFTVYSDKGFAIPSGLSSDDLLKGTVINIDNDASKVFVTPKIYDLIASGSNSSPGIGVNIGPNLSGVKFVKTDSTPVFIPGSNNYSLTQILTGSNSNNYEFGTDSAKISSLGNVLIVSSTKNFAAPRTGLFIFTGVSGNNWALRQTIPQPNGLTNPIGYSSALSSDGSIIATSSWGINGSPGFIFVYTGNTTGGWNLMQTITGASINSGFARNIAINEASPFSSSPSFLAATEDKKVSVYRFTTTGYVLYNTIQNPDMFSDSSSIAMSDTIRTSQNVFASYIIIGTPNASGALVYRQTFLTGWGFVQKLSGSQFDGSSISINKSGDILILGNRLGGSVGGYVDIYTGRNILSQFQFKQRISGFGFQSQFGNSVSIKDTTIVIGSPGDVTLGDGGVGRIYIYTGSKENGWALSRSFTGTTSPEIKLGTNVDIYNETVIASAPKLSGFGAINVYNPTSFTNVETYISEKSQYAIWNNPVMKRWIISDPNGVGKNLTSPTNSFITNVNDSIDKNFYFGVGGWAGSVMIFSLNQDENSTGSGINAGPYINKLHVYNTPGITGFAGTYSSGTFMIQGSPRVGFRNDQNPDFYIYKNNLPSAWRAVQYPADYAYTAFTWYSATGRQGVDEDPGKLPPVIGWRLGDNSVMNPPPVTDAALPLPEMNFGHCAGNTLIYPNYVYQIDSTDLSIDNIKLYSGGVLSSSGTSELFSGRLSEIFPDVINAYFDINFYYTNIVNNSRFLLFRKLNTDFDQFLITKVNQNYNSGYYYWLSDYDYIENSGKDTFQQARKFYIPVGNNTGSLHNISINMNKAYSNQKITVEKDLNLNTLNTGDYIYLSTNKIISGIDINGIYNLQKIASGNYSGLNCFVGPRYIIAGPQFQISGARCWESGINIWSVLDNNFNYVGLQNCERSSGKLPSKYWFTGQWSNSALQNYYNFGFTKLHKHNELVEVSGFSDILLDYNDNYNYQEFSGVKNLNKFQQIIFNLPNTPPLTGLVRSKITGISGFIGGTINGNPVIGNTYTPDTYNVGKFSMQLLDQPSDLITGKYSLKIIYNDTVYSFEYTGKNSAATYYKYSRSMSSKTCNLIQL